MKEQTKANKRLTPQERLESAGFKMAYPLPHQPDEEVGVAYKKEEYINDTQLGFIAEVYFDTGHVKITASERSGGGIPLDILAATQLKKGIELKIQEASIEGKRHADELYLQLKKYITNRGK